ncbi:MAG: acetamidase/formamidase family protein [Thermomicrobiales bacterium]|nr:acetamidase/formamidase family protein [Thermomicrobiales bacterium]
MVVHQLAPTAWFTTLGPHQPVLRVRPGDAIVAQTLDANGWDAAGVKRASPPNPMSGPVFVEGAEPGDALGVTIEKIVPTRATGWSRAALAHNVVDPDFVAALPPRDRAQWRIDPVRAIVELQDAPPGAAAIAVPLAPMIGCFGVAPAGGEAIATSSSGPHGGNMDWRGCRPGATVWFPVAVPGANFFLGDGHAAQGDGEICGTGVETACEMTVTLQLRKGWRIAWPRGTDAAGRFTIGNARPLDQALQHATTEMLRWLLEDGLDAVSASHLLGQSVRYDIANAFNPAYSVVCRIAEPNRPAAAE